MVTTYLSKTKSRELIAPMELKEELEIKNDGTGDSPDKGSTLILDSAIPGDLEVGDGPPGDRNAFPLLTDGDKSQSNMIPTSGDKLLEELVEEDRRSYSDQTIPLGFPVEAQEEEAPLNLADTQELPEDYVERCLDLMNEFRIMLGVTVHRMGPSVQVGDGQLLDRVLEFCRRADLRGQDVEMTRCTNFFHENIGTVFTRLLTDDNVSSWNMEVQKQIQHRCAQALQLIAVRFQEDCMGLIDLLSVILSPASRYMCATQSRHSETYPTIILPPSRSSFGPLFPPSGSDVIKAVDSKSEDDVIPPDIYARCFENRTPRGYLVDFINIFGQAGGFDNMKQRLTASDAKPITISLLVAWLKPFGVCADYLTKRTVENYFLDIFTVVSNFLESMSDEEFKKESGKQDGKTDPVTTILRSLRSLSKVIPEHGNVINQVIETTRLSAIMKLLKVSTYNGKMHALNEINRIIQNLSYSHRPFADDDMPLGSEKIAKWIQDNHVLSIILSDSMHQPQYVDKLEKIIRFMLREKSLTLRDLDDLWNAQNGKHEAIVKNVHDLLTKLAWDFLPDQLDHLFGHFQSSWSTASRRQQEKLLELIRRLAEDDKEGVMAVKVLDLLWSLCHNEELPAEIMEQALAAHLKILDYSCSQDRDHLKTIWLKKCVEEIKKNSWVVPALRHIRNICEQFSDVSSNLSVMGNTVRNQVMNRSDVLNMLINEENIIVTVTQSLEQYLDQVRIAQRTEPIHDFDPAVHDVLKSKYSHTCHVESRLSFLRYILQQGHVFLQNPENIWACLAERPTIPLDRDQCFKWFHKLMSAEEPDLEPEFIKSFYESKVLQLDPLCLTESGMHCFSRFLRYVNTKEGKLEFKRKQHYLHQSDLVGIDYLWKIILTCREEIAQMGIDLLRDLYAFPSPKLQANIVNLHKDFILECMDQLRPIHDNLGALENDKEYHNKIVQDANKAVRILKVITEYILQYDKDYGGERARPPLAKATCGRGFIVIVKSPSNSRASEDYEVYVHTNETVGSMRRSIYQRNRLPTAALKLDLYFNNEALLPQNDRRLVSECGIDLGGRDKPVMTLKLGSGSSTHHGSTTLPDAVAPSSPDSSNDISPVDTPRNGFTEETNLDAEKQLPGVWMAQDHKMVDFFIKLADLGLRLANKPLLEATRNLLGILPTDEKILRAVRETAVDPSKTLDSLFHTDSPSRVLYNLQVLLTVILPSRDILAGDAASFCLDLITKRGFIEYVYGMLIRNNFLQNADTLTKQNCYRCILRLLKLLSCAMFGIAVDHETQRNRAPHYHTNMNPGQVPAVKRGYHAEVLHFVTSVPGRAAFGLSVADFMVKVIANKITTSWREGHVALPNIDVCKALRHLAWTAASGSLILLGCPENDARSALQKKVDQLEPADEEIAEEALDCLMMCLPLTLRSVEQVFQQKGQWFAFFEDLLVVCRNAGIRNRTANVLRVLGNRPVSENSLMDQHLLAYFFNALQHQSRNRPDTCTEAFHLVAALIAMFHYLRRPLKNINFMLDTELNWLTECRRTCVEQGRQYVHDVLLEGHLLLLEKLVLTLAPHLKASLRSKEGRGPLIQELIEDFLFPAARVLLKVAQSRSYPNVSPSPTGDTFGVSSSASISDLFDVAYLDPSALLDMPHQARAICQSSTAMTAAFDVIIALCVGSAENLTLLNETLSLLFYCDKESPITEWEYSPPVGPRRTDGFVGLKNAGATCYMNSVLQQLYMIPSVRNGLLGVEGIVGSYADEEIEDKGEGDGPTTEIIGPVLPFCTPEEPALIEDTTRPITPIKAPSVQDYNLGLIKQLQMIFSHLACSKLQFYIPRGFWKHFRLGNEPVNLREQHDALEFYNSVVDSVDEGLKAVKKQPLMGYFLGGTFADQKICRDCPHRYSREEPFTSLNVDIRNFHTLQDALELYVKGDLLEGANAYFCEKCQRKVDTIKRLCIKRLPPILTIQLKRFDYDWEREQPIKFNDYFEFPRQMDMEPYTAAGLAKIEGQTIPDDEDIIQAACEEAASDSGIVPPPKRSSQAAVTQYRLVGIVVHSGQATGGHYYSYILDRDGESKWYRFDDGDVTECKMDDDEEMKAQCFGGEQPRQKRWWNAYILFYERMDVSGKGCHNVQQRERQTGRTRLVSESIGSQVVHMIPPNLRSVIIKENLKFIHNRSQFTPEYFAFLKRLLTCSVNHIQSCDPQYADRVLNYARYNNGIDDDNYACAAALIQLLGKFIFDVCFRTRRALRGLASEWSEGLVHLLRYCSHGRVYFTEQILLKTPRRIFEYLVECPAQDVRVAFSRTLGHLTHYGIQDENVPITTIQTAQAAEYRIFRPPNSLGELVLMCCMSLIGWKEMGDHTRQIAQYFAVFQMFLTGGPQHRNILIGLGVPELFIRVVTDDVQFPICKYNSNNEIGKLFPIISSLIRSIDFSEACRPPEGSERTQLLPNPFAEGQILLTASVDLYQTLYQSNYFLRKIMEETSTLKDVKSLIEYLSWECQEFSMRVIYNLLAILAASYVQDVRSLLEFVFEYLPMEDSWMMKRCEWFLTASEIDTAEGFLSIMTRNRTNQPRRAYLCFKYLMLLANRDSTLGDELRNRLSSPSDDPVRTALVEMTEWLHNELEQGGSSRSTNQYFNPSNSFYSGNGYSWNNSHNQTVTNASNDTSNGSQLERTASAKTLLAKAMDLLPDEAELLMASQSASSPGEDEEDDEDALQFNVPHSSSNVAGVPDLVPATMSGLTNYYMANNDQWPALPATTGHIPSLNLEPTEFDNQSITAVKNLLTQHGMPPSNKAWFGPRRNGMAIEEVRMGIRRASLTEDNPGNSEGKPLDDLENTAPLLEDSPYRNESVRPGTPADGSEAENVDTRCVGTDRESLLNL